ncbi:hypothetical protein KKF55_06055 [Patescibacteria group bacterium]|nr:hypothetical protein [Patescibacteria group bacterium]
MKYMSHARIFSIATLILCISFITWICIFKITSADFWWHIKAGQIMRDSGWITTEPFAHTRIGAPYLAIYSWLSQIILSVVYDYGGARGVIMLRALITLLTFGVLLMIDRKRIWPNAFLVMAGAIALRTSLLCRPQLFTFLMISCALFVTFKLIEAPKESQKIRTQYLIKWIALFILIHILWTNLHGGAALLSFGLFGAVLLQKLFDVRSINNREVILILVGIILLIIGSVVSPNTTNNLTYVFNLFTDQTKQFILEWGAPNATVYLKQLSFFWIIAVSSLMWTRKNAVVCIALLLIFGYLSISAGRHMSLFIIVSLGVTIYQLKYNSKWQDSLDSVLDRKFLPIILSVIALLIILIANEPIRSLFARTGFDTFGTYEEFANANEFIEKTSPSGNMFNSYSLGAYLLFHGYPDRKIFVDGRNVDHGYPLLKKTFDAAYNKEVWKELEDDYALTYAIIDYRPKKDPDVAYPYGHLNENPQWALVFLDDWAAIYFKRIPENASVISKYEYSLLTPDNFMRGTVFDDITQQDVRELVDELLSQSDSDKEGITSLLLLADIFIASQIYDNALAVLDEAILRQPRDYRPYEIAAEVYGKLGNEEKAEEMYGRAVGRVR